MRSEGEKERERGRGEDRINSPAKKKSPTEISSWQRQKLHSETFQIWIFAPIVFSAIKKVINITFILLRYINKRKSGAQHFCIVFLLLGSFTILTGLWSGRKRLNHYNNTHSTASFSSPFSCLCLVYRLTFIPWYYHFVWISRGGSIFTDWLPSQYFVMAASLQPSTSKSTCNRVRETTCLHISSSCTKDVAVLWILRYCRD